MYDRNQPEFAVYKMGQTLYAKQTMDELCAECSDEPFDKINNIELTAIYDPTLRSDDPVLQEAISQENTRATEILDKMFVKMYPAKVFDGKTLLRDADRDGVDDRLDQCLNELENYNDYLDTDGCPDSVDVVDSTYAFSDADGDGITDLSFGPVPQSISLQIIAENESDSIELITVADKIVPQSTSLQIIAENESDSIELTTVADKIVPQSTSLQNIAENESDSIELTIWTGRTNITMNVEDTKTTPTCLYYSPNFKDCIRDIEEG